MYQSPSYNHMGKADFEVEAPKGINVIMFRDSNYPDIFCKNQKKIRVRFWVINLFMLQNTGYSALNGPTSPRGAHKTTRVTQNMYFLKMLKKKKNKKTKQKTNKKQNKTKQKQSKNKTKKKTNKQTKKTPPPPTTFIYFSHTCTECSLNFQNSE